MGELVNTGEVLHTAQVLDRETQRLRNNGRDEYGMPLRRNPPTHDPRQYYTTPFLINKLRSIIPIEIDLFLQTAYLEFYRGEPEDRSHPLSLLRIGYLWYDDDGQPIENLFVADKGAYYSDAPDLVPYTASGDCRRLLVAQDGFWGSGTLECFNTCNGLERTNINLASGKVQTLIQFMLMLGDRRRYFWYEQPHDAGVHVHVEQLVHVIKTATHDRMYPERAKRNPRPFVPRPPPPSPADAGDGGGLAEAERLVALRWHLQEMRELQERQEREQMRMQMQQMQLQPPIDPRLLADTPGTADLNVVPGTQDMISAFSGTGGENGFSGSGGYAAVGNEFLSAETGGRGPPAGNGALPVGSGYPPAGNGRPAASNAQPRAGGFDFVFQAGGGPSNAARRPRTRRGNSTR